MSTTDDLRATLDQHGHDLVDTGVRQRTAAVRHRVRVVRRRRRAAGAVGTAAAAAVVAALVLVPGGPQRTDDLQPAATLAGHDVAPEIESYGITYRLTGVVGGDEDDVHLSVDPSGTDRLVTWATSGPDDTVEVEPTFASTVRITAPDLTDRLLVPAGSDGDLHVSVADGTVGLAVYERARSAPGSVGDDSVSFRPERAGGALLGAVVGEVGESAVSVPAIAGGQAVVVVTECVGGDDDTMLEVDLGGQPGFTLGSCGAERAAVDPAAWGGQTVPTRPGQDVTLDARLVDGVGRPVDDPDARLAVGLYDAPATVRTVVGTDLPELVERDGRTWRFDRVEVSEAGADRFYVRPDASGTPHLAVVATQDVSGARVRLDAGDTVVLTEAGGSTTARIGDDQRAGGRVLKGASSRSRFAVAFYLPVD